LKAEEELRGVFEQHGLPAHHLALQSQSALTMIVLLANSDFLTMVPIQWTKFAPVNQLLVPIPVKETFSAPSIVTVRRAGLPLTPAAEFLLDLLRRRMPSLDRGENIRKMPNPPPAPARAPDCRSRARFSTVPR
jgi:LysR family transcriptional regulator of abg operon